MKAIFRARLASRVLNQEESVVLIVAPAGYGKTTLARDVAGFCESIAIIRVEPQPNRELVLRTFVAAIAPHAVSDFDAVLSHSLELDFDAVLFPWLIQRIIAGPQVLVIDDLHHTSDGDQIDSVFARLISATHTARKWIVLTRSTPMFPIGDWIAAGAMTLPIGPRELAFDSQEASEVARGLLLDIPQSVVEEIVAATNGWPLGVRLALQLSSTTKDFVPPAELAHKLVETVLNDHVWNFLTESSRCALFAASVLYEPSEQFLLTSGYDVSALRNDSKMIDPFIQRDSSGYIAIHDSLRDFAFDRFMITELDDQRESIISILSEELRKLGRSDEAVKLFVRCRSEQLSSFLVNVIFELYDRSDLATLRAAVTFLQVEHYAGPVVSAILAVLALSDGRLNEAIAHFSEIMTCDTDSRIRNGAFPHYCLALINTGRADDALTVIGQSDRTDDLALPLGALAYSILGNKTHASSLIDRTRFLLEGNSLPARALAFHLIGFASYQIGKLDQARSFAQQALTIAVALGNSIIELKSMSTLLATASMADEDARQSRTYADDLLTAAIRVGNRGVTHYALTASFFVLAESGDYEKARAAERALLDFPRANVVNDATSMCIARVLMAMCAGDPERALSAIRAYNKRDLRPIEKAFCISLEAVTTLSTGDKAKAIALIEKPMLIDFVANQMDQRSLAYAHALRAFALWLVGRRTPALRSFSFGHDALGARDRAFVEIIRDIIDTSPLLAKGAIKIAGDRLLECDFGGWAVLLAKAWAGYERPTESLTRAELEVLTALDKLNTIEAVAKARNKSPVTIRRQLSTILSKVHCSTREEALEFAKSQGWLPQ